MRHWVCERPRLDGFPICPSESRQIGIYCSKIYSLVVLVYLAQVRSWCMWFNLCHVKRVVVGADQLRTNLFPLSSIIAIVPLRLMAPDAPSRPSDVWTLTPPDSIVTRLVGCQGDRHSHDFYEVAYYLMVRRRNDFHFVKPCMSHNGIVGRQTIDHRKLHAQCDWVGLDGQHNIA